MSVEVKIDGIGLGIEQFFEPNGCFFVVGNGVRSVNNHPNQQVIVEFRFAFYLRFSTQFFDVIHLHPLKIVFALGVKKPKNGIGIGLAVDVRNAPIVSNDGDVFGLFFPPF